jgi:tRNA (guanine37-N1)-methyltransferase
MIFHILTLFPEMFHGFLNESILKKAQGNGVINIELHNIRDFSKDKHHKVDDTPYGGGAGMVFMPQPVADCIDHVKKSAPNAPVIYLSPRGERLTQARAETLIRQIYSPADPAKPARRQTQKPNSLILLCGHYEGIDQRVIDGWVDRELSIGDYVLSGGELGAMVVVDVLTRLIPGALGNETSHEEETFSKKLNRKKEYPHYTRPADFRGRKVPEVLLSGHHAEIEAWRRKQLK